MQVALLLWSSHECDGFSSIFLVASMKSSPFAEESAELSPRGPLSPTCSSIASSTTGITSRSSIRRILEDFWGWMECYWHGPLLLIFRTIQTYGGTNGVEGTWVRMSRFIKFPYCIYHRIRIIVIVRLLPTITWGCSKRWSLRFFLLLSSFRHYKVTLCKIPFFLLSLRASKRGRSPTCLAHIWECGCMWMHVDVGSANDKQSKVRRIVLWEKWRKGYYTDKIAPWLVSVVFLYVGFLGWHFMYCHVMLDSCC